MRRPTERGLAALADENPRASLQSVNLNSLTEGINALAYALQTVAYCYAGDSHKIVNAAFLVAREY